MNIYLRPCIHCGNVSPVLIRSINKDASASWHVECRDCGIRTDNYTEDCNDSSTYSEVTNAMKLAIDCCAHTWNYRKVESNCDGYSAGYCDDVVDDNAPDIIDAKKIANMVDELCEMASRIKNKYNK